LNPRQRGVDIEDGRCILCGQDDESTDHVLMQCHFVNACWKEMNIQSVTAMPQAFREYIFLHLNLGVVGRRRARLHWRLGLLGDNVMIECGILQYFRLIYRAVRLGLELYEQWKAAQSALLQAAGQVS